MSIVRSASFALVAVLALPAMLVAQGGGGFGAPPKNLQVLPKEMTRQQVMGIMRTYTSALGVKCEYCHVPPADAPPPAADAAGGGGRGPILDHSLDTKDTKKVAREMMKMVNDINAKYIAGLTAMGRTIVDSNKVTCATCHRGAAIPHVDRPAPQGGGGGNGGGQLPAARRELGAAHPTALRQR
jgi:hypothetical protein